MILPYLDYGDIFYMNANAEQLQTLQNRAIRICFSTNLRAPIEILHNSAQLPRIGSRRTSHLLNFMLKNRNNKEFLNTRNVRTRLHDAPVFVTIKPDCEKVKNVVF